MCSVAYLCVVSPACGNDLFVVVVCILVRKRAGPWKVVAAYQNVTSKCDNSTVCTWSKGNGRVGPRLDNLVSERTHRWQQSDDNASFQSRREENSRGSNWRGWTPECPRKRTVQRKGALNQ